MNFFEHQDRARRKTGWLVLLFVIGVAVVAASVCGAIALVAVIAGAEWHDLLGSPLLIYAAVGTALVIGCGTTYKIVALAGGGPTIAESLGGRRIVQHTSLAEQRLCNVVEEMAIASGMPVPVIYMLDSEHGINAFAAGYTPGDAVIGVTRGCAERLERDQLQGVVAHEFGHIINGDMRLNVRLIGVIHGIVVIGLIGKGMFRSMRNMRFRSSNSKDSGKAILIYIVLALLLLVIGWVGTLFGNLVRAAISRQREYLADASAVQLTRNPQGLAGALRVIGGFDSHAIVESPNAPEIAHMFFCEGVQSMFATHPPLVDRIRRIAPSWRPETGYLRGRRVPKAVLRRDVEWPVSQLASDDDAGLDTVIADIAAPSPAHLRYARHLVASLPDELRREAHDPFGARAVVCALLLDDRPDVRREQMRIVTDRQFARFIERLEPNVNKLERDRWLPLLDMCMPALRSLTRDQSHWFRATVRGMIDADDRVELFEWVLWKCLERHLSHDERPRRHVAKARSFEAVTDACVDVLSALAHASDGDADAAFSRGAAELPLSDARLAGTWSRDRLDAALDRLDGVSPMHKRKLLTACARCIATDGHAGTTEVELFRAVADTLGCPVPPILPGQRLV